MKCWNCGKKTMKPAKDDHGHPFFVCSCGATDVPTGKVPPPAKEENKEVVI